MKRPVISIIMPVYNSEEYLKDSIGSILNQTYQDFELLLVDSGSSDNSILICKEYEAKDNRINVVHGDNSGVSVTRNRGIQKASGEYIRFVDADDILPPDSLENLLQPFQLFSDIDMVIGRFESNDTTIYFGEDMDGRKSCDEFVNHCLKYIRSFYYGVIWNKLYRKDIITEHQITFEPKLSWSEDLFFNLQYFRYSREVYYISKPVYMYIRRQNSLSAVSGRYTDDESFSIELRRFEAIRQFAIDNQYDGSEENKAYNFLFNKINERLNSVFEYNKVPKEERFAAFCHIAEDERIHQWLIQYPYKNNYYMNSYMISMLRKKKCRALYRFYAFKAWLKKNKRIRRYSVSKSKILPKYPL